MRLLERIGQHFGAWILYTGSGSESLGLHLAINTMKLPPNAIVLYHTLRE
jgi:hypothetical protein